MKAPARSKAVILVVAVVSALAAGCPSSQKAILMVVAVMAKTRQPM